MKYIFTILLCGLIYSTQGQTDEKPDRRDYVSSGCRMDPGFSPKICQQQENQFTQALAEWEYRHGHLRSYPVTIDVRPGYPNVDLSPDRRNTIFLMEQIKELSDRLDRVEHDLSLLWGITGLNVHYNDSVRTQMWMKIDSLERRPLIYLDTISPQNPSIWVKDPVSGFNVQIFPPVNRKQQ
jgi:hypothetical protein